MRRIFVEPDNLNGDTLTLEGDAFHHAAQVLRFKVGDEFQIISGQHWLKTVRVETLAKKLLTAKVISTQELPKLKEPKISLAYAMPRLSTFEEVVEKAVELGVHRIQPLFTEYSFIKSAKELGPSKLERLDRIIKAATEQSCRGDLMQILPALDLKGWLEKNAGWFNRPEPPPCLFFYERAEGEPTVKDHLQLLKKTSPLELWTLVGAEGGFSLSEVEFMRQKGLTALSLGSQILRAETACLATISILKYEFDLL
jgi:16S rRNA (uracil1498-N3)-methyltransferase